MSIKPKDDVRTFVINQATTKAFRDLYVGQTMIILVQSGSKLVRQRGAKDLEVLPGELLIFPAGTFVTIENRIISGVNYAAHCISYPDWYLTNVFPTLYGNRKTPAAIHLDHCPKDLVFLLRNLDCVNVSSSLPDEVRQHRLLEPLVWLRCLDVQLGPPSERSLDCRLRDLFTTDPSHKWRSPKVASQLGYSEATLRRKLASRGASFSKILMSVRLERGLMLLQTTQLSISQIALDCGFATPSHFSDAFKTRFDIQPKLIRNSSH